MSSVVVESYGARVRVDAPGQVLDALITSIAPFASPAEREEPDATLDAVPLPDGTWIVRSDSIHLDDHEAAGERHLRAVLIDRLHSLFAEHARGVLFVHAGAFRIGSVVVVAPGRSRAGKSSLVAEALRRGAEYFSDDFAVIDPDGLVHPYPRLLGLRVPSGARRHVAAREFGADVAAEPAPVDIVLSTTFVSPGTVWSPVVISGSRATLPIVANTVRVRLDPSSVAHMAAAVARRATTLVGERGEAADLLDTLRPVDFVDRVGAGPAVVPSAGPQ